MTAFLLSYKFIDTFYQHPGYYLTWRGSWDYASYIASKLGIDCEIFIDLVLSNNGKKFDNITPIYYFENEEDAKNLVAALQTMDVLKY